MSDRSICAQAVNTRVDGSGGRGGTRGLREGNPLPQVPTNLPPDRPVIREVISASAGRHVRSPRRRGAGIGFALIHGMSSRLPESPSGAARWLRILLAAALALLVP